MPDREQRVGRLTGAPEPEGGSRGGRDLLVALGMLVSVLSVSGVTATSLISYQVTREALTRSLEAHAEDAARYAAGVAADFLLADDRYQLFVLGQELVRSRPGAWKGAAVLDAAGRVVAESGSVADADLAGTAAPGRQTGFGTVWHRNGGRRTVLVPIRAGRETVGQFALVFGSEELGGYLRRLRRMGWALGIGLLCLALVVALPVTLWVTTPLRRLQIVAARVSEGDLSVRADEEAWGEAGDLGRSFNRMLDRIQRLLDDVRVAEGRAQQAQRLAALAQLGGGLAHEIKNPLTTVKLLLEHVSVAPGAETAVSLPREDLDMLLGQVSKIDDILEEFLSFARPRPLQLASLPIPDLIDRVAGPLRLQAREKGVSVEVCAGPARAIQADPSRVERVVANLVLNALHHSPPGGTVRVGWEDDGPDVVLRVEDQGPGVPRELRDRIFDPFFTAREGGLGLGLAIARSAVGQHGWSMEVGDADGGGARFEIRIPREGSA